MDKLKALNNLIDLRNIFLELNIKYWLNDGTCLGAIREQDFIAHDTDLDIGIYADQIDTNYKLVDLFGKLLERGFKIYHTFGELNNGFELAIFRNGIKCDIFWFYRDKIVNIYWHSAWLNGGRRGMEDQLKYGYPLDIIDNLKTIKFKGEEFKVPAETEKYLEIKYGEHWRVPEKNWDWAYGPKNLIK